MDDHLNLHVSIDTAVVVKQVKNFRALVKASDVTKGRSEFDRGWHACLKAVAACFNDTAV
jgi:hypothetical protein